MVFIVCVKCRVGWYTNISGEFNQTCQVISKSQHNQIYSVEQNTQESKFYNSSLISAAH